MCSNPQTAFDKATGEQMTFACRVCNECIATRKNDWVVRAMAEAAVATETIAMELTYRPNPDGTDPDAAKAFKYSDVADFLKRIREDYKRKYGARGEISFIVAGERGSKGTQRVHWHILLFCKRPVSVLGKWWTFFWEELTGPILSKPKEPVMIHWSHWPYGHVVVKEPDQGGVQYVLKYALKDQFNVVKSKGTMRYAKAENHGASYFRMSKAPPIGFRWLESMCDEFERKLVVPTALQFKVPEYRGFWWPKGKMRDYVLQRLHEINEKRRAQYGRDCPQWNTLLASVESETNDWEALTYGEQEEETEGFDRWKWQDEIGHCDTAVRRRCGGALPCRGCYFGTSKEGRRDIKARYRRLVREYVTDTQSPKGWDFETWYRAKRQINPFCTLKDEGDRKAAFRA